MTEIVEPAIKICSAVFVIVLTSVLKDALNFTWRTERRAELPTLRRASSPTLEKTATQSSKPHSAEQSREDF